MDLKGIGSCTVFSTLRNVDNVRWGDVVVYKEDPEKIRQKYDKKECDSRYVRNRLIALKYVGYTHAKVGANGRTVVYGIKVEPRYADFLELENEGKIYKIKDLIG